ncbi:kinase-like protein [Heliocybe sulcata]|uniref:Kinase-like protein n=1 Tax=Heliocybe sulcata TaxID=5364 RepID=A0A5C3NG61_9AGAM|nr:kinase-like protein [Heliocybe sulcata]
MNELQALSSDGLPSFLKLLDVIQIASLHAALISLSNSCTTQEADRREEHCDELDNFLWQVVLKTGHLPPRLFLHGIVDAKQRTASTCNIYQARVGETGEIVAIKVPRWYGTHDTADEKWEKTRKDICREAMQWRRLHHPRIYPFLGFCEELQDGALSLVSPWSDKGDMLKFLKNHPDHDRLQLIEDIADGLHYLHSQKFVHGDLKAANILMDAENRACIADFGLSKFFHKFTYSSPTSTVKGTTKYLAPEILLPKDSPARTTASDVFSFAYVYTAKEVWPGLRDGTVTLEISKGRRPERPSGIPNEIWAMIESCWKEAPGDRMSASQIVSVLADFRAGLYLEPLLHLLDREVEGKTSQTSAEMQAVQKILACLPEMVNTLNCLASADPACAEAVARKKPEILDSVQSLGTTGRRSGLYNSPGSGTGSSSDPLRIATRTTEETTGSIDGVIGREGPATKSPVAPSMSCLAYLNQLATQSRFVVQWLEDMEGFHHTPTWKVQCLVDGTVKGTGSGTSKQSAKEQAAQNALDSLGRGRPGSASPSPSMPVQSVASPVQSGPSNISLPPIASQARSQTMPAFRSIAPLASSLPVNLQTFNEEAVRRRLDVKYLPIGDPTGPPNNPTWAYKVMLDGIERGNGTGTSKKAAMEAAAKQAYQTMGWGH